MNKDKIMQVVRVNLLSIICGIVAIAAVVAAFWPVGGKFADLKNQADQRAAVYSTLEGLRTKQRNLPQTDPDQTQPTPLNQFPTQKIIDLGNHVTQLVHAQSTQMADMVVALNQKPHALLVPDALPNPLSNTPQFRFAGLYKLVLSIDPAVSQATSPDLKSGNAENLRNDILHATLPPTEQEIADAKAELYNKTYLPRIIVVNGQPVNQQDIQSQFDKAALLLPDQLKLERAKQFKVYMANEAFTLNPNVIGVAAPNPVDIWYAQQALWVQQDVARAIAEANEGSANILDAPVKQLVRVNMPPTLYVFPPGTGQGGSAPAAAPPDDTASITKVPAVSPTGRVSNPLYDVIAFQLIIDVDAARVPDVLAALTRDRLLDVYNMDVYKVDLEDQRTRGFFYGSSPVVRLNLTCEDLFMRQWTAALMPPAVRAQLGAQPPAPPTPAAPASPTASAQ